MPGTPTTRLSIPTINASTDGVNTYPSVNLSQMGIADESVTITEGTLVSRPSSSLYYGQTYYATDTGLWYFYTGSAWVTIEFAPNFRNASSSLTANPGDFILAAPSVTITLPSVGSATIPITVIANNAVTAATAVTVSSSAGIVGEGLNAGSFSLGTPGASVTLLPDGSHWDIIAGQQNSGWGALPLNTNWVTGGSGYTPAYRVVGDRVQFRGVAANNTGSTSNTPIATPVPAAIRPASTVVINLVMYIGSSLNLSVCSITSAGVVSTAGSSIGNTGLCLFDGLGYSLV